MRKLPELGAELTAEIERAWAEPQEERARKRLLVVRLIAQHELTVDQIVKVADVSRQTVFTYRDKVVEEGVEGLLRRKHSGGRRPLVRGKLRDEFVERLSEGRFRSAKDAQAFVRKRTRKDMSESGVRQMLRRLGGRLKTPRKSHAKKDPAKANAFKAELPARLTELMGPAEPEKVRIWVLDEHRYGLLPVIRRCWGLRGVRVHAPYATKYRWGYLHEALEVDGANDCQLLFTPAIDRDVHALFLGQIGALEPDALHVVIADQAGFHLPEGDPRIPQNIRLLRLPPYCPELNPVERFGGLLKAAVGNRLYSALPRLERHLEAAARPWSRPERVRSLIHDWMALQVKPGAPI
jgi:transposase